MRSAMSSKGMFPPSEVPGNRVQKLILNITTTALWQGKKDARTTASQGPGPTCRSWTIFQVLPLC